jgi:hypothetical protein
MVHKHLVKKDNVVVDNHQDQVDTNGNRLVPEFHYLFELLMMFDSMK